MGYCTGWTPVGTCGSVLTGTVGIEVEGDGYVTGLGEEIVEAEADGGADIGADGITDPGRVYVSMEPMGAGL